MSLARIARCIGCDHGSHQIDRLDLQIADHVLEGLPASNLFGQRKIAGRGHVVLAQFGLAGNISGEEADLLCRQAFFSSPR